MGPPRYSHTVHFEPKARVSLMTRVSRSRDRILSVSGSGSTVRTYPPNPVLFPPIVVATVGPMTLGKEYCDDKVGPPWEDAPFTLSRSIAPRVLVSGVRTQSGAVFTTTDQPIQAGVIVKFLEPWGQFSQAPLATSTLTAMAIANMNPNRPDRDIPVSILELRELPSLLKESVLLVKKRARNPRASSKVAKANIMANFGIAPILQDIVWLFDFVHAVDKREKYLRELSVGFRRIKRRLTTESWDAASLGLVPFHSLCDNDTSTNKIDVRCHATRSYWYTARARLLDPPSEREIRSLAEAVASGTHTISAEQAWNLIPWTWLIDWFSDTGAIVGAWRGGLRWQWEGLNIMYKTDYYVTGRFPNMRAGFSVSLASPSAHGVTKHRLLPVVSIYPQWRIPYLTASQWSILGSLTLLRI
jgi:hypothetical protein